MDSHRIEDPEQIERFIGAGRARFTIVSVNSGKRFTYRAEHTEGKPIFVSLLTGSNNMQDYTFVGTIFPSRGYICSRKSVIKPSATSNVALKWFIERLNDKAIPPQVEFWHEGRCGKCARPLTDPVSIARGFGPECVKSS